MNSNTKNKETFYNFSLNNNIESYKFSLISNSNRKNYRGSEHPSKRWGHTVILYNKSMIIFGGRHSLRTLSNLYSLDFTTLTWSKIEPFGNIPLARDSHSAIIYKNKEMYIFGGNGTSGKLNDLYSYSFSDRKWTKIIATGDLPSARDGHLSILINENFMVIYKGFDEKDKVLEDIYLYNILTKKFYKCLIEEQDKMKKIDCQACCQIDNIMYIFGGEGPEENQYSNDLYCINFIITENMDNNKPIAKLKKIKLNEKSKKPCARGSCTLSPYKNKYLIIVGGETFDKKPLNDIWVFNLNTKIYTQVFLETNQRYEERICHSCIINGDIMAIYGGMHGADNTLDNLAVYSLDFKESETNKSKEKEDIELIGNNKRRKISDSKSNNINEKNKDFCGDTNDLENMNFFSLHEMKRNYLNNLMTWDYMQSLTEFYQWPFRCLGNFIQNSIKLNNETKNIHIGLQKIRDENEILLYIKDDGKGINYSDFNGMMYSFIKNQNKDLNYFQYGFSMKASSLRLANSFLIITKTVKDTSIGLISQKLQEIYSDKNNYIFTPIVNYKIEKNLENNFNKYIPKSNYPIETLNIILDIVSFLFQDADFFKEYLDTFETGTHIYLFDLKTIDNTKGFFKNINNEISKIYTNYELVFDEIQKDIYLNQTVNFNNSNIIDLSFKQYLKFFQLKYPKDLKIFLFNEQIDLENPYYNIKIKSISGCNIKNINSLNYIKNNDEKINCFNIVSKEYNGILFNEKFIDDISQSNNIGLENIKIKNFFNGILIYKNNTLICRLNQDFLGELNFFIQKFSKISEISDNSNTSNINDNQLFKQEINLFNNIDNTISKKIFKINGYIELPFYCYELMFNNSEIKDQALYGYLYGKIKNLKNCIFK